MTEEVLEEKGVGRQSRIVPKEVIMKVVFIVAAAVFILAVITICVFIFVQAFPALKEIGLFKFLFGDEWYPTDESNPRFGIAPMIVGSVYITGGALIIGVPIGFLTAVFMARYCPKPVYKVMKPITNILAGIPSIVYGYFGLMVIVPFVRETFGGDGMSILTASIVLGIMILPTIISVSENAIRAVPKSYYEGAIALGATKERAIFRTEVPAAKSGIVTSIILGLGRVIGETMAVVMICGNQARFPDEITDGVRTMTANIVLEMSYADTGSLHEGALIATAAVLFVFILIITALVALIRKKSK
ncbi:MAG TPA: phosphate ABC transporter permease subunit PstC [Candidatus Borkfalkia excrementavium]|uniref:Phosphate transport system permease protein n=1 Tax=Candidatus Borkfalkia excrementavium TaxID=2838505 RepID=A0A9D1Z7K1_9FIRM|nr:phosphate ABC transporter permease subunit PstC [Candidatus Borkfalkia excrementavium]